MKRRIITIFFVVLLLVLGNIVLLTGCSSVEIALIKVKKDVFVYDQGAILDESTTDQINRMLVDLEKKTSVEFAVITINSLSGYSIETYSLKLANGLGIGKESTDNGILLLISKSDTRVRLEIGKGLEGILNDAKCGRILDEFFVPYRNGNDYNQATLLTVQAVINVIAEDAGVSIDNVDETIVPSDSKISNVEKVALFILLLIVIIIITLCLLGIITEGGSSDSSRGSFFSSDSDGSSGSFGGGSFGGGGASR